MTTSASEAVLDGSGERFSVQFKHTALIALAFGLTGSDSTDIRANFLLKAGDHGRSRV
jgi:hypothetical protein